VRWPFPRHLRPFGCSGCATAVVVGQNSKAPVLFWRQNVCLVSLMWAAKTQGHSILCDVAAAGSPTAPQVLGPCGLAACSDPPVVPSRPLGVSPDPPAVPSGPRGVSVPSGPFGVPPYSPACSPVPLVSLGSHSLGGAQKKAKLVDSLIIPGGLSSQSQLRNHRISVFLSCAPSFHNAPTQPLRFS
jgi:hypothetical protein